MGKAVGGSIVSVSAPPPPARYLWAVIASFDVEICQRDPSEISRSFPVAQARLIFRKVLAESI